MTFEMLDELTRLLEFQYPRQFVLVSKLGAFRVNARIGSTQVVMTLDEDHSPVRWAQAIAARIAA